MPSTSGSNLLVRPAQLVDLPFIKALADAHRHELGFVLLPSLREQIERGEMIIAKQDKALVGFVDYHRRRDGQVTLYHIVVAPTSRRQGVGRSLLAALEAVGRDTGCFRIALKCPIDLVSNHFYEHYGFVLNSTIEGRKRPLNLWTLSL
jgi:GNAT superfamily N-acetyltransferase